MSDQKIEAVAAFFGLLAYSFDGDTEISTSGTGFWHRPTNTIWQVRSNSCDPLLECCFRPDSREYAAVTYDHGEWVANEWHYPVPFLNKKGHYSGRGALEKAMVMALKASGWTGKVREWHQEEKIVHCRVSNDGAVPFLCGTKDGWSVLAANGRFDCEECKYIMSLRLAFNP